MVGGTGLGTSDSYDVNTHPYNLLSMTQHSIVLTFAL